VKSRAAKDAVTTRGPSGIGFVNFGELDRLDLQGPSRTFGAGAPGIQRLRRLLAPRLVRQYRNRRGRAVGVQASRLLPILEIAGDLRTQGVEGQSLVNGVQI
jgi:hypothetical protein